MALTVITLLISTLAKMSVIDQKSFMEKLERILTVQNKMGIHARPAAMIVRLANKYEGEVWVEKDDEQVNGKSIMGLMMLAAWAWLQTAFHLRGRCRRSAFGRNGGAF